MNSITIPLRYATSYSSVYEAAPSEDQIVQYFRSFAAINNQSEREWAIRMRAVYTDYINTAFAVLKDIFSFPLHERDIHLHKVDMQVKMQSYNAVNGYVLVNVKVLKGRAILVEHDLCIESSSSLSEAYNRMLPEVLQSTPSFGEMVMGGRFQVSTELTLGCTAQEYLSTDEDCIFNTVLETPDKDRHTYRIFLASIGRRMSEDAGNVNVYWKSIINLSCTESTNALKDYLKFRGVLQ